MTGCREVGGPKHWYMQRSQLQEQQTHFFEQLTSHAPEEHTKSHRLPCTYSNGSTTNTEYDEHPGSFEDWCSQREQIYPQFEYWTTVLALELSTLIYVRSLREANFSMYSVPGCSDRTGSVVLCTRPHEL